MALTAAMIQTAFKAARSALPAATVKIRHQDSGAVYSGVRSSLDVSQAISGMGAIQGGWGSSGETQGAIGAVRLTVSELTVPHPKAGDIIEIVEQEGGDQSTRVILSARYDQARATVRIDYGEQYG